MNDKLLGDALRVTTENCAFSFNDENYIQVDGVAMGSPLGPTLANIFMCHFEQEFLEAYEGPTLCCIDDMSTTSSWPSKMRPK